MAGSLRTLAQKSLAGTRFVWRSGVDFLYPPCCLLCGGDVFEHPESRKFRPSFCDDCRAGLIWDYEDSCQRCAAPVGPHLDTTAGCIHCRGDRFAFEKVVRLGVYEGLLKQACRHAKNSYSQPLAAALGELLWEWDGEELHQAGVDLVVPIPQYWTRRFQRSHNPAETLGRVLARRLQVEFHTHILTKVRRTPAQSSLTPPQRRANLRGAFRVRRASELKGRSVLLVDDVFTTGTTANEASKVLRKAGAERVVVAVSARGLGRYANR
ncbi:MAG: ComF family protein [Planctomycetes bacterium]|nr:ComF family protein [Planctomycetota bacterium]